MNVLKTCSRCGLEKDIENFCKNKKTKDGFGVYCKDCQRVYFRNWQEENHERHKIRSREYYRLNKDAYKAYRQAHRERIITYQKIYRKFNREYLNSSRRLRRQKMRAKAAWDVAKRDLQQIEESADVLSIQLGLLDG